MPHHSMESVRYLSWRAQVHPGEPAVRWTKRSEEKVGGARPEALSSLRLNRLSLVGSTGVSCGGSLNPRAPAT